MCRFISAVLPAGADLAWAAAVATRYGRRLQPLANPSVQAQLRPGELHCLTTAGHCDCDSAVGRLREAGVPPDRDDAPARLRRRGWSEARIRRALEQQGAHRRSEADLLRTPSQAELERWGGFLEALLGALPYAGLLLHDYEGRIEGEEVRLKARVAVPLSQVGEEWLGALPEDVLYEIRLEG